MVSVWPEPPSAKPAEVGDGTAALAFCITEMPPDWCVIDHNWDARSPSPAPDRRERGPPSPKP
jgi:hypothetical protein